MFLFVMMYLLSFHFVLSHEDWFLIWFGLELNMMSFIVLIYNQSSMNHVESSLKYFFVQSLGSALFLISFYLYFNGNNYLGSLIMSYKMGAGVFFYWFPSVCSGVGWISCFFLMTFQKIMPLWLMTYFMGWVVWLMLIVSLMVGAWGSLNECNLKRLMSYSSIHHAGWLMMCICVEMNLWLFYMFLYMLMIFPVIYVMKNWVMLNLMEINKWKSKMWLMMGMLSMGGMPPFLGFFLKWLVFYYMKSFNWSIFMFMIIMSVLMFYIYIRVVYDLLMGVGDEISWGGKKSVNMYMYMGDLMSSVGVIIGLFLGLMMLL